MSKHIVEETPTKGSHAQGDNPVEKQASQLAYDVKYKVKQGLGKDTKMNPAQIAKAYLSQLAKSPAPPAVKALAKKKLMGEDYTSDIAVLAEKAVVNAMVKVFSEEIEEKKYKVRVTDKKTGNTYIRNATRAKIAELRANPNISSVEMTSYGEVSDDEKKAGKKTAAAKAGKDYDGDGKVESGAKEYRGAVHNAIQRKKGLKADGKDTSSVKEEIQIDEGLRSAVKRLLGKKDAPAEKKPESRGEQLRKKYNVGPEKSDTSAKRQILDRTRARKERDEKEYGGSVYTKSVAKKSADAHDRYLKAGYSKYGADQKHGSGNKARRRAAALQKNEFEWLVNSLLGEGYDLSAYTVDQFYDFCEEVIYEKDEKTEKKDKVITGEKVNNYNGKDAVVKLFPNLGEQAVETQEKPDSLKQNQQKRQLTTLQQFQNKERQLNQQKLAAQKSGKVPVGSLQVSSYEPEGEVVDEAGDYWHPDPKKDAQISGAGNKMRAREDQAAASKPKEDPKKLKPGESYMDYAKRHGYKSSEKPSFKDKLKSKLGLKKEEVEQIDEKAVSKAQQKFMGMVYAAKKGEEPASPEVAKAAAGISKKEAKKFAGTKHKGLPEVKEEKACEKCGKSPCECDSVDERETPTKMDLVKNKLRAKGIKVAGITPSPRNMKTYDDLGEELLDERRKEEKVAGTPRNDIGKTDLAYRAVKKTIRDMSGGRPAGQQKKEPGKKPPVAGQYGAPKSPAQKVAQRRAAAKRSQDNMSSRFD